MKLGRILRRSVRWLVYLALAAVCYLLQACVFSRMPILGAGPLILPVAVACVALWEGADRGALFGLLAGVLCDAAMGRPAVMYTLLLTALGVGVGALSEKLLRRGLLGCLACSFLVLAVCILLHAAGLVFLYRAPLGVLAASGGVQLGYSMLFALPVYLLCRPAEKLFKRKEST